MATAIQKVSAVFWVLPTAFNYLKGKKIDWVFLGFFALAGLVGAYFGVLIVVSIPQRILEVAIGVLILFLVLYTFFQKGLGLQEHAVSSRFRNFLAYPFAIILGFYETLFGSGNGILFSLVSFYTKGFDFVKALGYYFAIAFVWVVFASFLFISIGSRYARFKGNSFIKFMFLIVGGALGIKLILGV